MGPSPPHALQLWLRPRQFADAHDSRSSPMHDGGVDTRPQKDWRVELWLQPGAPAAQGKCYAGPSLGKVAVVLGAGNQGFLAVADVLYMAFVEGVRA